MSEQSSTFADNIYEIASKSLAESKQRIIDKCIPEIKEQTVECAQNGYMYMRLCQKPFPELQEAIERLGFKVTISYIDCCCNLDDTGYICRCDADEEECYIISWNKATST